jgi:hypothetical protein
MIRHMRSVTLQHATGQTQNNVGKMIPNTSSVSIDMAITLLSGNKIIANDLITRQSTHMGITPYDTSTISVTDTIEDGNDKYTIDFIPPITGGRLNQLYLKLVK